MTNYCITVGFITFHIELQLQQIHILNLNNPAQKFTNTRLVQEFMLAECSNNVVYAIYVYWAIISILH